MKVLKLLIISVLLIWSYQALSYASPEEITFKSSLIWRADGQGDYLIPETYELPTAITIDGTIDTITASWEFTGEVTIELSADNGAHYTAVTNGVPLDSLLYTGNRLKWRATLAEDSELTKVKLTYTDSKAVIASFGEPALSGFKYRRALQLTGSQDGVLFNYQMKFQVDESLTKANFKDIRWTAADGETILPHYLEYIAGGAGHFWVKIPEIPEQGITVYLYYENPLAEDLSDPERVFDFFDDFDGSQLDTEKWKVSTGLVGSYDLSDSKIKLDSTRIVSKEFEIINGIIEVKAQSDSDTWFVGRTEGQEETDQVAYASMYPGAEHCIAVGNIVKANAPKPISVGTTYNYRVIAEGTRLTFDRYDENFEILQSSITYEDTGGLTKGAIGLETSQDNVSYYDWLRVRRYAEEEPIIASEGEEEETNLAQFSNTTLTGTGDLTLTPGVKDGVYVSRVIPTGFDTRIIVPAIRNTEDGIRIDVSADKGVHYKTGCESGIYYYVSRQDFTAGSNLQYRLTLTPGVMAGEISIDYAPGKITIISPNGGEVLTAGDRKEISWTASEYEDTYLMKLEYSLDKGKTYKLIASEAPNNGAYLWTVPTEVSKKAMVRISDALASDVFDESDAVFEIKEKVEEEEVVEEEVAVPVVVAPVIEPVVEDVLSPLDRLREATKRPGTTLYDVVIKLGDNTSPDPIENLRSCYKEGDIVLVRPTGHLWGAEEVKNFLIIQMYLTEKEARELTLPLEEYTGEVDEEGNLLTEQVRRRANRIDLEKYLGLPKEGFSKRSEKLKDIRTNLEHKPLEIELIEEK